MYLSFDFFCTPSSLILSIFMNRAGMGSGGERGAERGRGRGSYRKFVKRDESYLLMIQ